MQSVLYAPVTGAQTQKLFSAKTSFIRAAMIKTALSFFTFGDDAGGEGTLGCANDGHFSFAQRAGTEGKEEQKSSPTFLLVLRGPSFARIFPFFEEEPDRIIGHEGGKPEIPKVNLRFWPDQGTAITAN